MKTSLEHLPEGHQEELREIADRIIVLKELTEKICNEKLDELKDKMVEERRNNE